VKFCIVRGVRDDFEALQMSDAMLQSGGEPFSIVIDPSLERSLRWCVYARFDVPGFEKSVEIVAKEVDDLFDRMMGRT
jgi:hypothetical protein